MPSALLSNLVAACSVWSMLTLDTLSNLPTLSLAYRTSSRSGAFARNQKHGTGIYTWPTGNVYRGEFRLEKMCGRGEMKYMMGHVYVGEVSAAVLLCCCAAALLRYFFVVCASFLSLCFYVSMLEMVAGDGAS